MFNENRSCIEIKDANGKENRKYEFNVNRSCIEIARFRDEAILAQGLMKTEVVLKYF